MQAAALPSNYCILQTNDGGAFLQIPLEINSAICPSADFSQ
jgi:hypothetical protein